MVRGKQEIQIEKHVKRKSIGGHKAISLNICLYMYVCEIERMSKKRGNVFQNHIEHPY